MHKSFGRCPLHLDMQGCMWGVKLRCYKSSRIAPRISGLCHDHILSALYCTLSQHSTQIMDMSDGVYVCCPCCTTGSFMAVFAHPGSCIGIPPVWPDSYGRASQGECIPALPGAAASVCVRDLLCCDLVHHCQVRKRLTARLRMSKTPEFLTATGGSCGLNQEHLNVSNVA